MTTAHPEKILILGDGIEAWMSAAFFSKLFATTNTKIILVARNVASIKSGVSSVHPSFREFLNFMGLDERTFVKHTHASYKLADFYSGWSAPNTTFFHAYGDYGADKGAARFHQAYVSLVDEPNIAPYDQYSIAAEAAKHDLFGHLGKKNNSTLSNMIYSWHFHTKEFTELLMEFCRSKRIAVQQGNISVLRESSGDNLIQSVYLETGDETRNLTADLYINCLPDENGINNRIEKTDWHSEILTNTTIRTLRKGKLKSSLCDVISTEPYGYTVLRPAHERIETTLYSNRETLTNNEKDHFLKQHDNPDFESLTSQPFRLRDCWKANCISIGPSCISLPSHSISEIDLAWSALKHLIKFIPGKINCTEVAKEYNRTVGEEYDNIKDFVRLQFLASKAPSSEFWKRCTGANLSEKLNHKMRLFCYRGKMPEYEGELFDTDYQIAFLIGMNFLPKVIDPLVRSFEKSELINHLQKIKRRINEILLKPPRHNVYLKEYMNTLD